MLSKRTKRFVSIILSLSILLGMTTMIAKTLKKTVVVSLSEYVNREVLVMYKNGTFDVLKYESADALASGLETIADDENIKLYQPNYSYEASSLSVDDELAVKQWALHNDGSFYMEEQKMNFPFLICPLATLRCRDRCPDSFKAECPVMDMECRGEIRKCKIRLIWDSELFQT